MAWRSSGEDLQLGFAIDVRRASQILWSVASSIFRVLRPFEGQVAPTFVYSKSGFENLSSFSVHFSKYSVCGRTCGCKSERWRVKSARCSGIAFKYIVVVFAKTYSGLGCRCVHDLPADLVDTLQNAGWHIISGWAGTVVFRLSHRQRSKFES